MGDDYNKHTLYYSDGNDYKEIGDTEEYNVVNDNVNNDKYAKCYINNNVVYSYKMTKYQYNSFLRMVGLKIKYKRIKKGKRWVIKI